jgi:citrate lyase subunit beta/citryl-CoA lyase
MAESEIRTAHAGPQDTEVRSDAHVAYAPGDAPLRLEISSRVDYLYGEAIESSVRRVVDAFGVDRGTLGVSDAGALDWVLLARIEACLRRAGFEGPAVLPEAAPGADAPRTRDRLRRSRLYIPGNRPKLAQSAGLHGADGIILDLEDSVTPTAKDEARLLVRNALVALDFGGAERMVRINQDADGERDLEAIAPYNVHVVLLPKVESPEEVVAAAEKLRQLVGDDQPFLMPILESPMGVHRAFDIAAAEGTVVALTIGLEDLSAELGAPRTAEGTESFIGRQRTVYAARAAGVAPIASVYSDVADEEGLADYVRRERALGFDGIGCIHPRQIPVVHREFCPSEAELERAIEIVRAARDAEERGLGAVAVGSKMVDPPVVKQAMAVVELARASGVLDAGWEDER